MVVNRRKVYKYFILVILILLIIVLVFRNLPRHRPVPQIKSDISVKSYQVQAGENFSKLLNRAQIPLFLADQIIKLLSQSKFNFYAILPTDTLKVYYQNDSLIKIQYIKNYITIYNFDIDTNNINYSMLYKVLNRQTELVKGEINSSLYESMLKIGEKPTLIANFADILSWDIDFFTETHNQDSFFVLVEKIYEEGNFINYGRIYAVRYKGKIGDICGYYYKDPNGNQDYYDNKGQSLRKAFLKAPLRYSHISSSFSRGRYHPILKIVRPHHGIDYVAPAGTPVSAIGAGTITYVGWKGGYGRLVEISHGNRFKSRYGHLRAFGKGIRSGQRVAQGQIIGYVGATGLATGPHLHFELLQNGSWVNPLKIIPPRAEPVKPQFINQYLTHKDSLYQKMN